MSKNKSWKQNYNYWRAVQREQLGYSANIYFLFGSAILGYILNLLASKTEVLNCVISSCLTVAMVFLIISLIAYAFFTNNRLNDFRETSKLYKQKKSQKKVMELTVKIGQRTWIYYNVQFYTLAIGFVFSAIGVGFKIYS